MSAVLGFLKSYGFTILMIVAVGLLYQQNRTLQEQLKNPLIDPKLLERVLKAAAEGKATKEQPIIVNVAPQGAGPAIKPVPVQIFVQPPVAPPRPGEPAQPPRLVAESPAIYCKTKDECDRLYQRAPQALTVDAQIRVGVLAMVCLQPLDAAGMCPVDKRFSGPLVEPIKFTAQFVLAERGIFQGLNIVGGPLEITRVRTETAIQDARPGPPLFQPGFHYGARIDSRPAGSADITYQNLAWRGEYRLYLPVATVNGSPLWLATWQNRW